MIEDDSTGVVYYLKTAFAWICGLEKTADLDGQSARSETHGHTNISIREGFVSSWHKECSYAAICMLSICAFIWAFFTDYRIRLS